MHQTVVNLHITSSSGDFDIDEMSNETVIVYVIRKYLY
jgi:hypothetical protein